jgi:hypothetical protein
MLGNEFTSLRIIRNEQARAVEERELRRRTIDANEVREPLRAARSTASDRHARSRRSALAVSADSGTMNECTHPRPARL